MEDKIFQQMIEEKKYRQAIEELENRINELLKEKFKILESNNLMEGLEYCINNYTEYYDLLTYLRNLVFYSDKIDEQKLFELLNIYEVLRNIN